MPEGGLQTTIQAEATLAALAKMTPGDEGTFDTIQIQLTLLFTIPVLFAFLNRAIMYGINKVSPSSVWFNRHLQTFNSVAYIAVSGASVVGVAFGKGPGASSEALVMWATLGLLMIALSVSELLPHWTGPSSEKERGGSGFGVAAGGEGGVGHHGTKGSVGLLVVILVAAIIIIGTTNPQLAGPPSSLERILKAKQDQEIKYRQTNYILAPKQVSVGSPPTGPTSDGSTRSYLSNLGDVPVEACAHHTGPTLEMQSQCSTIRPSQSPSDYLQIGQGAMTPLVGISIHCPDPQGGQTSELFLVKGFETGGGPKHGHHNAFAYIGCKGGSGGYKVSYLAKNADGTDVWTQGSH